MHGVFMDLLARLPGSRRHKWRLRGVVTFRGGEGDVHIHGADSGKEWKGKERNGKVRKGKNKLGAVGVGQDGLHSRHWLRRGRRRPIGKRRLRPHLPLSSSVPQISSRSACVYTGTGNDTFEKSRLTCVPEVGGQTRVPVQGDTYLTVRPIRRRTVHHR